MKAGAPIIAALDYADGDAVWALARLLDPPITQVPDPLQALKNLQLEIEGAA